jgi:hypothetical protein
MKVKGKAKWQMPLVLSLSVWTKLLVLCFRHPKHKSMLTEILWPLSFHLNSCALASKCALKLIYLCNMLQSYTRTLLLMSFLNNLLVNSLLAFLPMLEFSRLFIKLFLACWAAFETLPSNSSLLLLLLGHYFFWLLTACIYVVKTTCKLRVMISPLIPSIY